MEPTRALAGFAADLTFERLPSEVVAKAKLCVLDFLANVHGAKRLDAVARVVQYVRALGGAPVATVIGCGFKSGLHHAAFLNGVAAEAIEAQDGLRFGGNHPGVAVIPAALAAAESVGASGRALLTAIVLGYEVAGRVAAAIHPHHTLAGFLPTGTCGTFGAAAAASKVLGHDAARMLDSLGNAGFLAPLSMAEHLMGGYTAKIVQGGQAASAGLTAAGLAAAGITGAPYVLEGSHLGGGFTQITTRSEPNLARVTDGLGKRFSILDIYFKPFAACRHTHGAAQATLGLVTDPALDRGAIDAVDVFTYGIAVVAVGKPFPEDGTFVSAQFSLPYVVAACLLDGAMGPEQLRPERLADPAVRALAGKVRVHADAELSDRYPEFTATRVEIALAGGQRLARQVDVPRGDPRDPMTTADLAAKLRAFAAGAPPAALDAQVDAVLRLDELTDVRDLTRTL
jgi:2-methylcitrate dehydratase PrpD